MLSHPLLTAADASRMVAAAKSRGSRRSNGVILTADRYVKGIEACVGALCPQIDGKNWPEIIKAAEARLCYRTSDMEIGTTKAATATKGGILEFDCVITSTRKDRDGDVLESMGATVDPRCPLLWQHVPYQPIGRLMEVTGQNKSRLTGAFVVADTELGRDAATLIELEALRISHGFDPIEFAPLDDKDGRWHIPKYEVVEVSVVSVPSNVDAVIESHVRQKLHSSMMKGWAKHLHDTRPVKVPGVGDGQMSKSAAEFSARVEALEQAAGIKAACSCQKGHNPAEIPGGNGEPVTKEAGRGKCPECGHTAAIGEFKQDTEADDTEKLARIAFGKDVAANGILKHFATKDLVAGDVKSVRFEAAKGSFEWVMSNLQEGLRDYLKSIMHRMSDHDWCYLFTTFSDSAIIQHGGYSGDGKYFDDHYRLAWKMVDGKPAWSGSLEKVDVTIRTDITAQEPTAMAKMVKSFAEVSVPTKAGRVLSSKNEKRIRDAHDEVDEVTKFTEGVSKSAMALCKSAKGYLRDCLDEMKAEIEAEKSTEPAGTAAATPETPAQAAGGAPAGEGAAAVATENTNTAATQTADAGAAAGESGTTQAGGANPAEGATGTESGQGAGSQEASGQGGVNGNDAAGNDAGQATTPVSGTVSGGNEATPRPIGEIVAELIGRAGAGDVAELAAAASLLNQTVAAAAPTPPAFDENEDDLLDGIDVNEFATAVAVGVAEAMAAAH